MKQTILALLLGSACLLANAAPREVAPAGFVQARQQFYAALTGDQGARDDAIAAFQALSARHPGHPLLAVYEGAGTALKGRDALMPWNKMKYAENGADAVEKALAQLTPAHDEALFNGTPESIETRLVAVTTLLSLPDFMNRRASGRRALNAALASNVFPNAAPAVRAHLFAAAARVAAAEKRSKEEADYLRKVVALAPQAQEGVYAASRLKELGL
ncbi:MAG: hypothetical protein V4724_16390 [Pseudomonadota bacterium]